MARDRVQRARTFLLVLTLIAFALSNAARSRGPFSSGLTNSADGPSRSRLRPGHNEPRGPGAAWAEADEMEDGSRLKFDARLDPFPSGTALPRIAEAFADFRDRARVTFRTHLPAPDHAGAPPPARSITNPPKIRRFPPRGVSVPAPAGPGRAVPRARPISISLPGTGAQGGGVLVHGTCIEEGPARDRANDHGYVE